MERDASLRGALDEAERAVALLWTEYPSTPWWYFPAVGVWAGALVLALTNLGDRPAVLAPLVLALLVVEVAFIRWMQRQRRAWPMLRSAPAEFRRVIKGYFAGCVLLSAAILSAYLMLGPVASAVVAALVVTAGLVVYERRYEAAVAATRERLG